MSRICPNCNSELKDHESYFCASCGQKLDEHLIRHTSTFQPRRKKFIPSKKVPIKINFKFNKNVKIALVLIVGFVLLGSLAMFLTSIVKKNQKADSVQTKTERKTQFNNTIDLGLDLTNIVFGSQIITKNVPENVDFYMEGNDFEAFYSEFSGEEGENPFSQSLEVSLNDRFAAFGRKVEGEWKIALVAELSPEEVDFLVSKKNVELLEAVVEEPDELDDIETDGTAEESEIVEIAEEEARLPAEVFGKVVVITEYAEFLKEIEQSSNGVVKNVTHNPKFSSFSAFLPPDGQFIFMNFTQGFNDMFALMESFNPKVEVVKMLEQVSLGQYDKFVIRDNE